MDNVKAVGVFYDDVLFIPILAMLIGNVFVLVTVQHSSFIAINVNYFIVKPNFIACNQFVLNIERSSYFISVQNIITLYYYSLFLLGRLQFLLLKCYKYKVGR